VDLLAGEADVGRSRNAVRNSFSTLAILADFAPLLRPLRRATCTHKPRIGRMSALGVNRICQDGGSDVNDPIRTWASCFAAIPTREVVAAENMVWLNLEGSLV
jgi:hypothetical protein